MKSSSTLSSFLSILAVGGLLAGCTLSPDSATVTTTKVTATEEATAPPKVKKSKSTKDQEEDLAAEVDFSSMQEVSNTVYSINNGRADSVFRVTIDGKSTLCMKEGKGVTCVGQIDPESHPAQNGAKPNAISLTNQGLAYVSTTPREALQELETGQWTQIAGVRCSKPSDKRLVCQSLTDRFILSGSDHRITTERTVYTGKERPATAQSGLNFTRADDVLVKGGGILCGAMQELNLVEVAEGEITCLRASRVIDNYHIVLERKGDTAQPVTFGDWSCQQETTKTENSAEVFFTCRNEAESIVLHSLRP